MSRTSATAILFLLSIISLTTISLSRTYKTYCDNIEVMYTQAIMSASLDATAIIQDVKKSTAINFTYDGYEISEKEIQVDYESVINRFYTTLFYNLGMYGDLKRQNDFKMHIPIKGVVGYDGICLSVWNDSFLPKMPYAYYSESRKMIYYYTLGDDVKIYDIATGIISCDVISNVLCPVSSMSHYLFKQYIVSQTVNKLFSEIASNELNLNAYNQGKGIDIMTAQSNVQNSMNNVIDSPGLFALFDDVSIGLFGKKVRIFNFKGSQLKLR